MKRSNSTLSVLYLAICFGLCQYMSHVPCLNAPLEAEAIGNLLQTKEPHDSETYVPIAWGKVTN